jgi:hypothetical protein
MSRHPRRDGVTAGAKADRFEQSQLTASPVSTQCFRRAIADASATDEPLIAALAYTRAGLPVFPCSPQDKKPLTRFGFKDATTQEKQIRTWWGRWPDAMIGSPTGAETGVFVLDVDWNERTDGFPALASLERQYGNLPETLRSVTPRGGSHYFFRWRDGIKNTAGKLGLGLDVRGNGGYVILPPFRRDDGKSYEWAETSAPAPVEASQWLIDLLLASKERLTRLSQPNTRIHGNDDANAYARAALERECANIVTSQVGTRNDALNRASYNLHQFVAASALAASEVQDRLFSAATACGLVKDDGAETVLATIKSGATAGLRIPRTTPEQPARHNTNENGNQRAWQQEIFTASDLQSMTFLPVAWLVPDIIPAEGVTLLCSKPKFGKSWLAYDLCIACTTARYMLGTIKPAQGDVLYLALEDSKRRLQRRMGKLLPTFKDKWPSRLGALSEVRTEYKKLNKELDEIFRQYYP